jgi:hypothetical protein
MLEQICGFLSGNFNPSTLPTYGGNNPGSKEDKKVKGSSNSQESTKDNESSKSSEQLTNQESSPSYFKISVDSSRLYGIAVNTNIMLKSPDLWGGSYDSLRESQPHNKEEKFSEPRKFKDKAKEKATKIKRAAHSLDRGVGTAVRATLASPFLALSVPDAIATRDSNKFKNMMISPNKDTAFKNHKPDFYYGADNKPGVDTELANKKLDKIKTGKFSGSSNLKKSFRKYKQTMEEMGVFDKKAENIYRDLQDHLNNQKTTNPDGKAEKTIINVAEALKDRVEKNIDDRGANDFKFDKYKNLDNETLKQTAKEINDKTINPVVDELNMKNSAAEIYKEFYTDKNLGSKKGAKKLHKPEEFLPRFDQDYLDSVNKEISQIKRDNPKSEVILEDPASSKRSNLLKHLNTLNDAASEIKNKNLQSGPIYDEIQSSAASLKKDKPHTAKLNDKRNKNSSKGKGGGIG